jgi:hypothetical protein
MIECVGLQSKSGSFVDTTGKTIDYDNVIIYYVADDNPDVTGYFARELKVSRSRVNKINFADWSDIIGKQLELAYNIYGNAPRLTGVKIVGDGVIVDYLSHQKSK